MGLADLGPKSLNCGEILPNSYGLEQAVGCGTQVIVLLGADSDPSSDEHPSTDGHAFKLISFPPMKRVRETYRTSADPPHEESKLIETPDLRDDPATPVCRKCGQEIGPRCEQDILDKFGNFVHLRCSAFDCGHMDWYENLAIVMVPALPPVTHATVEGPGQVWVHDVMLEISFRADAGIHREDSIEAPHSEEIRIGG